MSTVNTVQLQGRLSVRKKKFGNIKKKLGSYVHFL